MQYKHFSNFVRDIFSVFLDTAAFEMDPRLRGPDEKV